MIASKEGTTFDDIGRYQGHQWSKRNSTVNAE